MILTRELSDKDLETKKEVKMDLHLTDQQLESLLRNTFLAGLKHPEDLLESFLADLSGWHSNGSDEEMYTQKWYDRAYGGRDGENSFLFYLFNSDASIGELEDILEAEDEDPDETGEVDRDDYPYNWYESYLESLLTDKDEADSKEKCIALVKRLFNHQKDGEIDWKSIEIE